MQKLTETTLPRKIKKLRVSVTEVCNLRCRYCMPETPNFGNSKNRLSYEQLASIAKPLISEFHIEHVRITGGEPLVRPELYRFVGMLKNNPIKKLGMTTNGLLLKTQLPDLKTSGLDSLNISLDSLDEETFFSISRRKGLNTVIDAIDTAVKMGFQVKLNCVVMREYNFPQLEELLQFSLDRGIQIRFLEVMNIGEMRGRFEKQYVSAQEILKRIEKHISFKKIVSPPDSTSIEYETNNGSFGIIASESIPFCAKCSRLRLTSTGKIMGCLFREDSEDVKDFLFQKDADEKIIQAAHSAFKAKPYIRMESTANEMYTLGG